MGVRMWCVLVRVITEKETTGIGSHTTLRIIVMTAYSVTSLLSYSLWFLACQLAVFKMTLKTAK